jgi:hypothetical protein
MGGIRVHEFITLEGRNTYEMFAAAWSARTAADDRGRRS